MLSIVTINYNNAEGLRLTIESVVRQSFRDFEYIVIDGGSSDGSAAVIKRFRDKIHYSVSEPDGGVYQAMNKGIRKARGNYLLMLNSGDYLVDDQILETVFRNGYSEDIIYGNVLWNDNGHRFDGNFPDEITFDFLRKRSLGHQATFIHRRVHEIAGLYDENLKVLGDWKLLVLAICKFNVTYRHLTIKIAVCSRDGISCQPENLPLIEEERRNVILENFPAFARDYEEADELRQKLVKNENRFINRVIRRIKRVVNKKPADVR